MGPCMDLVSCADSGYHLKKKENDRWVCGPVRAGTMRQVQSVGRYLARAAIRVVRFPGACVVDLYYYRTWPFAGLFSCHTPRLAWPVCHVALLQALVMARSAKT